MTLRQAPRFSAYFSYVEGRQVLKMPRSEWVKTGVLRVGEMVQLEIQGTPIDAVLRDSRVEAAVAKRLSDAEVVIEVYRYDAKDAPTPINMDRYRLWERLPPHRIYATMVNSASTMDNSNMRGFLDDHVFLVKDEVPRSEHWLRELPAAVSAVCRREAAEQADAADEVRAGPRNRGPRS